MKKLSFLIKVSLVLVLSISAVTDSLAQGFFQFGYGAAYSNAREVNRMIYLHNANNDLLKDMPSIRGGHGLHLAGGYEEDIGFEIKWQNRHNSTSSTFIDNDTTWQNDFKVRYNTFTLSFYGVHDNGNAGIGIDFGNLYVLGRRYEEGGPKTDYEFLHTDDRGNKPGALDGRLIGGFTFFYSHYFGIVGARLSLHFGYGGGAKTGQTTTFLNTGTDWTFQPKIYMNNIGLDLFVKIGGSR